MAPAPTDGDSFAAKSVGVSFESHNMSMDEVRLTAIRWVQIAIGAIYLLTAALIPFLIDQPML